MEPTILLALFGIFTSDDDGIDSTLPRVSELVVLERLEIENEQLQIEAFTPGDGQFLPPQNLMKTPTQEEPR